MNAPEYKPTDKEEVFLKYYEKLIWETLYARAHLKLWERLENYKSDYLRELNQAPHFFTVTIKAHLDDALLTLSRILDRRRRRDPLSIWKFLNFVEQNREIFSTQAFTQRMRQKPDYDEYWVKSHTPITQKEIEEDRQRLENLGSTINNLITWRDKVIAHIDRRFYLKGKVISKKHPLKRQQLQDVIDALLKILNRYSASYKSSTFHHEFISEDDIQHVMDFIRFQIQERKKQLEALRRQTRSKE